MSSKYCSMSLADLRQELKKRKAKLTGRKKDLVERLESYDRNQNFGQNDIPVPEFQMSVPSTKIFKDIHADEKIAPISFDLGYEYLSQFDTEFDGAAINLYKEKYIVYLRHCETENMHYIKAACRAEMKSKVVYDIDISFRKSGCIHESQCECGAGQGPNGHCKHIRAVLYGCCIFNKSGKLNVELVCTEKLQSFHKVRRHTGSPLKVKDLNMQGCGEVCNFKEFDPRPENLRNVEGYPSYFRNTCLNFCGISTVPIFQLFRPANARAIALDHDYLLKTPEDNFLDAFCLSEISHDQIKTIEYLTRGQSKSEKWHEERSKRISSSNFGRICCATDRTDFDKLADSLLNCTDIQSEAIAHGRKFEKEALRAYKEKCQIDVQDCGIFVSKTVPFIGASPDGIVNDTILCEVKCPFSARNKLISPTTVPYLELKGSDLNLKTRHPYYYQVQGQLFCSERQYCDFIIYTISDIAFIRIQRDENFISQMLERLNSFYVNHFKPKLLEKFFYQTLK